MNVSPERQNPEPEAEDPRLLRIVQQYLAGLEAGRSPDRVELAALFPDLAGAMAPYLDALDVVHAATPVRQQTLGKLALAVTDEAKALGDFRIVRELGRGGMGVVYEAVQESLGRRVALKILSFAAGLDERQLQRFKNEAQAAAQLHHTNIVPVYFVGCERGVHFYAMQLIDGQNLAAIIEGLRGRRREGVGGSLPETDAYFAPGLLSPDLPAAGPGAETAPALAAELSTQHANHATGYYRTAARLAAQAAEALEYAHQVGIVHRDVKPANLMIDRRGNPWVMDFGLAQFHADAGLTQTGDLLGTLRYMSPEQASGQRVSLDHRTDVYSLGATLYELLTLEPIFDGGNRQELLHQILNEEPRSPRAIDGSIPAELETIVLKAMSKTPADRYASAGQLAEDLQRFLRHEPIRARRATPVQRARKWLRRHPSVPVAAAVLLVLLAAGSLVGAWLISGAYERERQRAEEAEQQFRLARRSADEMIQLAEEELADQPHMQNLRKRLLEAALVYYQAFIELRRDAPGAQAELEATRDRVKKILGDLAVMQGAGQPFLLKVADVLDDLRVSDEQRDRIAELLKRLEVQLPKTFQQFRQWTSEERRHRLLELARSNETAVAAILSREQLNRLQQIALQIRGPMVFRELEVVTRLKLTTEQRERIRAIENDMFLGNFDGPRLGPPLVGRPPLKMHEEIQKSVMEKIIVVMTEDQVKRWKEMTGAPFVGSVPMFLPGPPGPFGPLR